MTYEYPSSVSTHFLVAPDADRCLCVLGAAPRARPPPGSLWHLCTSSLSLATGMPLPSTEPCLLPSSSTFPRLIITSYAISTLTVTNTSSLNHVTTSLYTCSLIDHSKNRICLCFTLCFDMVQHSRQLRVCFRHFHLKFNQLFLIFDGG